VISAVFLLILLTRDMQAQAAGTMYQGVVYATITAAKSVARVLSGLAASLLEPHRNILLSSTTGALKATCSPGRSVQEKGRNLLFSQWPKKWSKRNLYR
jgi:hypothetical protein